MLRFHVLAAFTAAITLAACQTNHSDEAITDNCANATKFSVNLCIDDNEDVYWTGLWDECFNLGTQTSWAPAQGIIQIRSTWPLCAKGFRWKSVQHLCPVPAHTWTVEPEYNYWVGTIQFQPNECLAESISNCYALTIHGSDCPY
jgi:hypothetical protein